MAKTIYYKTFNSPVGKLIIAETEEKICHCNWSIKEEKTFKYIKKTTPTIEAAIKQLTEYFDNKRQSFTLELDLSKGTDFQQKVWQELQKIPFGKTKSYQEIATSISKPKASQAVGQAIKKNPIAIIIPCHRVIGKNKTLTGFSGGLTNKEILLNLEK